MVFTPPNIILATSHLNVLLTSRSPNTGFHVEVLWGPKQTDTKTSHILVAARCQFQLRASKHDL